MKVETKVGILFIGAIVLVLAFAYYLGAINPFSNSHHLQIAYNYAGGIEVGSPVRVMGIKVGKVEEIAFDPQQKMTDGEEAKLRIRISVNKSAWPTIRQDSRFYINLAGVIGEKFIEITPGSSSEAQITPQSLVRGEDPPRIDQLISQSYGLAGKILSMVEKNEGSVTNTIENMNKLVNNLNRTLVLMEKLTRDEKFAKLLGNIITLTSDMTILTAKLRGPEAEKTLDLLHRLMWRLDKIDEKSIREFLQKEGIRARLF